jgi:site-specific DNA-methyltransferase (adenine-specific)
VKEQRKTRLYSIRRADAFEWLAKQEVQSFQAVVTDPPYGVVEYTAHELTQRKKGKGIWRLPQAYDGYNRIAMPRFTVLKPADHANIKRFHKALARQLHRVLVPGAHVFLATQNLFVHHVIDGFIAAGFEMRGQVARVVKTLRGGDRPKGAHKQFPDVCVTPRSCWEPWLIFRKPCEGRVRDNLRKWGTGGLRRPDRDTPFPDLIVSGPVRGVEREIADHPSVKPQAFMRQIVAASLPTQQGIVLDPFMGSGATLAAATALGIRSVGVEIQAEYFALARTAIPRLARIEVTKSAENANGTKRHKGRARKRHASNGDVNGKASLTAQLRDVIVRDGARPLSRDGRHGNGKPKARGASSDSAARRRRAGSGKRVPR